MGKILNKYKRIIFYNIIILILLLSFPAIIFSLYNKISNKFKTTNTKSFVDPRVAFPTYPNKTLGNQIYKDQSFMPKEYKAFLGWANKLKNSKTVNIMGLYKTRYSNGQKLDNSTWFFGGSTMWGTGVSDEQTIPSNYHEISGEKVFNFGVGGYNSRHAVNSLISLLGDGHKPKRVFFYDGYNDVEQGCRKENKIIPPHSRELLINNALKNNSKSFSVLNKVYLSRIIEFLISPIKSINTQERIYDSMRNGYDCHKRPDKAESIAKHLVNNWYSSYLILKNYGIAFNAILHPTIYSSDVSYEYFTDYWKKRIKFVDPQFKIVYPLIVKELSKRCIIDKSFCNVFFDGSNWISAEAIVFFDDTHLNDEGNSIIAERLFDISNKK